MKIGITGNIGSGKTTVCKIFETLGIPVYYADIEAKRLMIENTHVVEKIKLLFGLKAYLEDGSLDRKYISEVVFNNPQVLSKLNYIVHPAVREDSERWAKAQKGAAYVLKEAALLVESESYKDLDKLIVVTAPIETRLQRVMKRDHVNKEAVLAREKNQMSEDKKIELADYKINNDGTEALIPQIHKIHQELLSLV
jgi:dephospho-CoA kinase